MKLLRSFYLLCCFTLLAATSCSTPHTKAAPQIVSAKKIWSAAHHNAFTDLIRFNDDWFCTFRESKAHVGGNGKIRILVSRDGEDWKSAALLEEEGIDLRDPKLSITPDHQLMLVLGGSVYQDKTLLERQSRVAFSKDGSTWTTPQRVLAKGDWLWRVTWHNGRAYGISYGSAGLKLVESEDGKEFRLLTKLEVPGRPNESTIRFLKNGDAVALVRREADDKEAWIGTSHAPYKEWDWKPCGMFVGGPNFIFLPDGAMLAGGRQLNSNPPSARMFVGPMTRQKVTPELILPSGGDCSYPGLVWRDGVLWVSYYSSHEGQTGIYLAKVKF